MVEKRMHYLSLSLCWLGRHPLTISSRLAVHANIASRVKRRTVTPERCMEKMASTKELSVITTSALKHTSTRFQTGWLLSMHHLFSAQVVPSTLRSSLPSNQATASEFWASAASDILRFSSPKNSEQKQSHFQRASPRKQMQGLSEPRNSIS